MNYIIADIDGVLLNSEHRLQYLLDGDLDKHHSLWQHDTVIQQGLTIYTGLINAGFKLVFVTGRSERAREYTVRQLMILPMATVDLLMRPDGDTTHDSILKPVLFKASGRSLDGVFMAFDDRASMVKAWRDLGVVCYQTDVGDF